MDRLIIMFSMSSGKYFMLKENFRSVWKGSYRKNKFLIIDVNSTERMKYVVL